MGVIIARSFNMSIIKDEHMSNISERLLEERKRLGLNQQQMADLGGVVKRTYCNYEAGEREPMGGFFTAIATAGADVQYILTGIKGMSLATQEPPLTPRRKALLDNIEHCSEEDQRAIERMALLAAKADSSETTETANWQESLKKSG